MTPLEKWLNKEKKRQTMKEHHWQAMLVIDEMKCALEEIKVFADKFGSDNSFSRGINRVLAMNPEKL